MISEQDEKHLVYPAISNILFRQLKDRQDDNRRNK
ncbi:hypothetical protein SAMN05444280_12057 [Tangfeifania diversioriginum]|uniref:Uncharacterized protein n=1 Tax=Tangfeifania diversioriginum TaxID=1168035 RepID=A0A1M6JKE3_9BACT|nr:hypothetical protein SAMN05444280_12057 [Tangfeifania diversioriginum]